MFQSVKEKAKALSTKVVAPVLGLTVAGVGSASATTAEDIAAAFTSGQTNLAAVATGVIALAAIMTGVGIVVKWLSR